MLKLDHWWDIKNDWLLWTQITYSFGWDRMNKKSKQGDIQWLRGQREVVGGPKMPIFVHDQG